MNTNIMKSLCLDNKRLVKRIIYKFAMFELILQANLCVFERYAKSFLLASLGPSDGFTSSYEF